MSLTSKLNTLHEAAEETPKIPIKELTSKAGYRIVAARRVETRFRTASILLEIDREEDGPAITFLPNRFVNTLTEEDLSEITEAGDYRVCCTDSSGNSPSVRIWSLSEVPKTLKKKKHI